MTENYNLLIDKLDRFIRRYYLNLLLKGCLLFGAGFLILFLAFTFSEYFGYFHQHVRLVLFYSFFAFNAYVLLVFVIRPFLGLIRIGKRLGAEEAARLLNLYFPVEVSDKITNALQLKQFIKDDSPGMELVMAGIEQKAASVSKIPFQNAIQLKSNLRFLPFVVVPLLFSLLFFFLQPSLILDPARRIVRYDTPFQRPLPFDIVMEDPGRGFRNENITLTMSSRGDVIPEGAILLYNGGRFNMEKLGRGKFKHTIRNLQESFEVMVESAGYMFGPFSVEVIQRPMIHQFSVHIQPPAYTGLPQEKHQNIGDIIVADGSRITWEFNTRGSGAISFFAGDEELNAESLADNSYQVSMKASESFEYKVYSLNEAAGKGDSLQFFVQVRPDAFPQIQVEEYRDSIMMAHLFQRGLVQDDYGFSKLEFHYRVVKDAVAQEDVAFLKESIDIQKNSRSQAFFHYLDVNSLYVEPGETVEYFFRVYDNDGIGGPKASNSKTFTFYIPSREEMLAVRKESDEQIRNELGQGIGEVRQARDELQQLRKQLLETQRMGWEQQEALKNLIDKQQQLQDNFEKLAGQKKQNEVRDEQFNEVNERLRDKQEELQRLFEEVLSDDLRELFDKIRQELENLNREQVYDMLDQMDFQFRDMEMQMDRVLELFRQLELERMMQQSIDMLDHASEKQGELNEDTARGETENAVDRQQEVNREFEQVQEMLEDIRKKNQDLSTPFKMENTRQQEENVSHELQQALEHLQKENSGKSQSHQQQGKQQMDQLSLELKEMQQQMFEERLAEDSRALRQILENLLKSSFAQEDLLLEIRGVNVNDPRYVELVQDQRKIQEDLKMIEDSLTSLGKRQIHIQAFVGKEIAEVNMNLERALDDLVNRRRFQSASRQQFVMTHINNLALLLNESLQNMQQQMAQQQGMGQPMPGGGEPSFKNMNQMQQQLNQMLEKMQQGHQPQQGQSGQNQSISEQLARMAAEQEAIRNQLRKITEELKSDGRGEGDRELEELQKEMERTEMDIVTRNITRQTILRQERILTRMLEHEKAELEREMEDKRVGNTAEKYEISNPAEIFEYNRIRNRELELMRRVPPGLRPFYRSLVENYFLNVDQ